LSASKWANCAIGPAPRTPTCSGIRSAEQAVSEGAREARGHREARQQRRLERVVHVRLPRPCAVARLELLVELVSPASTLAIAEPQVGKVPEALVPAVVLLDAGDGVQRR